VSKSNASNVLASSVRPRRRLAKLHAKNQLKFRTMHVRKGDNVKVLAGKDRGKTGRVIEVIAETERLLVEKINIVKRHQRPTQTMQKGGIIEKENSIHVSNVALLCPHCKEQMRPKNVAHDGVKTRACRKCNEPLDLK
jgi:large subunit ribosomal protein L24